MADKLTLEAALLARRDDPRALRGAITFVKGTPRIVFGVVGEHRRFSVDLNGDDFVLVDDPRTQAVATDVVDENTPEEAPEGGSGDEGAEIVHDPAETAEKQGEALDEAPTPKVETPAKKRGGKK